MRQFPRGIPDWATQLNRLMSGIRVGVEWAFGKIIVRSAFTAFGRAMRIQQSPVRKYYHLSVLFANAHTCFYGAVQTPVFNCLPPDIADYFGVIP